MSVGYSITCITACCRVTDLHDAGWPCGQKKSMSPLSPSATISAMNMTASTIPPRIQRKFSSAFSFLPKLYISPSLMFGTRWLPTGHAADVQERSWAFPCIIESLYEWHSLTEETTVPQYLSTGQLIQFGYWSEYVIVSNF